MHRQVKKVKKREPVKPSKNVTLAVPVEPFDM
jgi:hypothetical protein